MKKRLNMKNILILLSLVLVGGANAASTMEKISKANASVFAASKPAALASQPLTASQLSKLSKSSGKHSNALSDQAFANTEHMLMPLTPDQIKVLHYMYSQSKKAAASSPNSPPKPTSTSIAVNLSPGSTPPIIRMSQGFISTVDFVDATGAPWPIKAYDIGNRKDFNVVNGTKNSLQVQALSEFISGNLAVFLKGLNTAIMVTLMPGQSAVDYRVDMRVPELGPNARLANNGLPASGNAVLLNVLDGVPPKGATQLSVSGASGEVWQIGDKLYLRTRAIVLSPAWIATMDSSDGTHAYELPNTPIILASQHGETVKIIIGNTTND